MTDLEAGKQAHLSRCEQLSVAMDNIVKDLPDDALQKKYATVVSSVAGLTSQLASVTASENILQVMLQVVAKDIQRHSYTYACLVDTVLYWAHPCHSLVQAPVQVIPACSPGLSTFNGTHGNRVCCQVITQQ